jgi:rod shape-determining protein MreD
MTVFVMVFSVIMGAVIGAALPAPSWLGHAQAPVLLGLVLYYAMIGRRATVIAAAILAGLVADTLSLMPLGYSSFCFCVAGLVCQGFRDVVMARQWTTHMFFGAMSNLGITTACFLLLAKDGLIEPRLLQSGFKLAGSVVTGAVAAPLVFQGMAWLDRKVGNVESAEA